MEPLLQLAGTTLADKYRLVSLLGAGGMGVVYRAEQLRLGGRSVAVKLLRRDLISTRFEWFQAEALAASRINHPHAVAIYDFGVAAGQVQEIPFLVMEHLRGHTLTTLLERGAIELPAIATIGAQVLSALSEAHACGVVHCDLTADNIIVERLREGDDFAKVIDFGLARLFDLAAGDARLVGTAEYMAPEQIRGDLIQPATDLYAVGVLLYEMITGRTPFAAGSIVATLDGHLKAQPAPIDELAPECPPQLAALIARALQKDPDQRPASAGAMRSELLLAVAEGAGGDLSARPPVRMPRPPRVPLGNGSQPQPTPPRGSKPLRRTDRLTHEVGPRIAGGPPLAGREAELERILTFCRTGPRGGAPGALALVGPPGIGKARLALELGRRLGPVAMSVVVAADPSGLKTSWYPILRLLEAVLGLEPPVDLIGLRRAAARHGLPDRDLPGLAELFGLPGPASALELAVRRREAYASATRALIASARRHAPLVYCFADFDRYDACSQGLVRQLASVAPEAPAPRILVTAQAAPEFSGDAIELGGLDRAAAHQLASSLIADPAAVLDPDTVHALTAGSPGGIEQLAGWIARGDSPSEIPRLLVDVVSVRVNRLDVAARRVLQAVAVHGSVAPRWIVESCLAPDELAALGDPVWTGLLVIGEDTLTIPSDLVASVVWACTPADVRRRLHRRVLDALSVAPGAAPGTLGHHAEEAGELKAAYRYFRAAGAEAERRFDDPSASNWYGRAVAMARELEARGIPDAPGELVEASTELAEVLRLSGEPGLALGALEEAMLRAPSDQQRASAERTRGLIALDAGGAALASKHLQAAAGAALRAGDRESLCQIYLDLARALDQLGRAAEALAELEQAIDVITAGEGLATASAPERLWRVAAAVAERRAQAGDLADARALASEAMAFADRGGWPHARARIGAVLTRLCERAGEPGQAAAHRTSALDAVRQLGDRRSTAELLLSAAQAAMRAGDAAALLASPDIRPADPGETLRAAARLADEIGWREGAAAGRAVPDDE